MTKSILLFIVSFVSVHLVAQPKTVSIHGVLQDTTVKSIGIIHPADARLSRWENTKVDVVKGAFHTSLQVPFPVEISITYGNRAYGENFIYGDVEMLIDTTGKPHIIGSPLQEEYEKEFLPFFGANDRAYDSLNSFFGRMYQQYGREVPKIVKDSAISIQDAYYGQRATLLTDYIQQHPDSYVALWDLSAFVYLKPTHKYFDFERSFSSFSSGVQQQAFIGILKERLAEAGKMEAGELFPKDFFKGQEGLQARLEKDNQYYLIDFWYSHCGPCIKGFPRLKEIYSQFHTKGFDIVSVSVDQQKDEKDYAAAVKKYGLAWNHVWDKDGITAGKYSVNIFPTYVLVDKNGSIINYDIREEELEAFLKKKLGNL